MKKILVVDDNHDILAVMKLFLESKGFDVFTESNGRKTYDVVNQYQPDLIILDVFLGNSDGRDICNVLKKQDDTKDIPIIIFSANAKSEDVLSGCAADDFLTKPFELNELLSIVEHQLVSAGL